MSAAAMAAFAESGFDGASVEDICERAGFTRGAFYSNYSSKDELFLELAEEVTARRRKVLRDHLRTIAESPPQQRVRIEPTIERMLREAVDDGNAILLANEVRMRALRDVGFGQEFLEMEEEMARELRDIIAELLMGSERVPRIDVFEAALIIMHMWESVVARAAIAHAAGDDLVPECRDEVVAVVSLLLGPAPYEQGPASYDGDGTRYALTPPATSAA